MDDDIRCLSELVAKRNEVAREISALIGRPALIGHIGEFIASRVFDIELEDSASAKGIDGRFRSGPLTGNSVNVKWYAKREGILDIRPDAVPDHFLVLTGPKSDVASSRGEIRPWLIEAVFLFDGPALVEDLRGRCVKIGVAASVRQEIWDRAEVYPSSGRRDVELRRRQREQLEFFGVP